jgi:hypothetical protein
MVFYSSTLSRKIQVRVLEFESKTTGEMSDEEYHRLLRRNG